MLPWLFSVIALGSGVGTVEDFDKYPVGPYQRGRLDSWRWSPEHREKMRDAGRLEVIDAAPEAGRYLRVEVRDPQVLADEALPIVRLAPHFPPEADVLRVRLKVISGQVRIYAGGPTAYYGNSDVFTAIRTVSATDEPRWQTVDFNLNHPLWRNARRAGAGAGAPRNYYNRWAQEPMSLYLAAGSRSEFLIDRIDLASCGEGRPFPHFDPETVQRLDPIADFEDGRLNQVFNWYMADGETEWFDESWRRTKPLRFGPLHLSMAAGETHGTKALACRGATTEEVHGTGVRTCGIAQANALTAQANALVVKAWASAPGESNTLVGTGEVVPIDFFVFVSAAKPEFRWEAFAPSAELRAGPGPGFDYQLSYRAIRDRNDVHLAIYQTRRFMKPETWTTLTLPAADFTCICGYGVDRKRFAGHEALTLEDVVAVGWINPWCRSGRRTNAATTCIDEIRYARLPGTAAEHRSYWQISPTDEVRMADHPSGRGPLRRMLLPGDTDGLESPAP